MKKWSIYLLILVVISVLSFGGFGGEDAGKLYPVQAVMIRAEKDGLRIVTDGGQMGIGSNVASAIKNLHDTSAVRVFLDTADYLLLEPGTEIWLPQLRQYLRPSCNLCYADSVDPAEAATFLQLHEPRLTLIQYEAGDRQLPILICNEGRMTLVRY